MRRAINENPVLQAALIAVLVLGVGLMLLMRMGGSSEEATPPATDPAAATATDPATRLPADPAAAAVDPATGLVDPAAAVDPSATGSTPATGSQGGGTAVLTAGPGVPKALAEAYNDGRTVVVLVIREHPQGCYSKGSAKDCTGIDDQALQEMTKVLMAKRPDAWVKTVHAFGIARYSSIAQGVEINRVPALIVLQPKRLSQGPMPLATISYGFRGPESFLQVVADAEYKGPSDLPYYPR